MAKLQHAYLPTFYKNICVTIFFFFSPSSKPSPHLKKKLERLICVERSEEEWEKSPKESSERRYCCGERKPGHDEIPELIKYSIHPRELAAHSAFFCLFFLFSLCLQTWKKKNRRRRKCRKFACRRFRSRIILGAVRLEPLLLIWSYFRCKLRRDACMWAWYAGLSNVVSLARIMIFFFSFSFFFFFPARNACTTTNWCCNLLITLKGSKLHLKMSCMRANYMRRARLKLPPPAAAVVVTIIIVKFL